MRSELRQILDMVAEGKITAEEGERLFDAVKSPEDSGRSTSELAPGEKKAGRRPRYLRVLVEEEGAGKIVNIRVPLLFLRAGMKLASFVPGEVYDEVLAALHKEGIPANPEKLKPEDFAELVNQLEDLDVNVDADGAKVRIFCD